MVFFFFNDTATTEIYTLSHTTLFRSQGGGDPVGVAAGGHDGVAGVQGGAGDVGAHTAAGAGDEPDLLVRDRKSTRLNSSHSQISYAVFCLKKKNYPTERLEHPQRLQT